MNSGPHLLTEDRPQFERVLDQALRAMSAAPPTSATPAHRLNTEQLRTLALDASAAISARASAEYETFLRARERDRAVRPPTPGVPVPGAGNAVTGAGLFPMMAVLTPVLAGVAAVIFLAVGFALGAMSPEPVIASQLRTAGWTFLALAGIAVLVGTVGMLLTAMRDGHSAIHATDPAATDELSTAREAWSAALLERGMRPFLTEALATADTVPGNTPGTAPGTAPGRADGGRRARAGGGFGYSAPGFSSPDFTGPDTPGLPGPGAVDSGARGQD